MRFIYSNKIITAIIILALFGIGTFVFVLIKNKDVPQLAPVAIVEPSNNFSQEKNMIGLSVEGRKIESYTFGKGATHIAFVGGIHGGYEWNSVLLSYKFIDYLTENPNIIPQNLSITVIPSANPDGVYRATGKEGRFLATDVSPIEASTTAGRFNANKVDLNRNFDCKWKPTSTWRQNIVSAGMSAFSEPETKAIQGFVTENKPTAVIFWHSQSNAVYASECKNGILPETLNIMDTYAKASGYPAVKSFSSYEITGDAEGWLASINIPAITVELKTHETLEWESNLAGVKGLFDYYSQKSKN